MLKERWISKWTDFGANWFVFFPIKPFQPRKLFFRNWAFEANSDRLRNRRTRAAVDRVAASDSLHGGSRGGSRESQTLRRRGSGARFGVFNSPRKFGVQQDRLHKAQRVYRERLP